MSPKPKFQVVMLKSLEDFFNLKKTLFYICTSLIVPLFFAIITSSQDTFRLNSMILEMQAIFLSNVFAIISFVWLAGLPLVLFSIIKCSSFISGEDSQGTLLILVSKPLKRYEIIIGKLLAYLIYLAIIQAAIFFIATYIWALLFGLDLYVFVRLLATALPIYLYSIFVGLIFGSISTALSAISKSTIKTITVLVLIAIFVFFGCSMIRTFTTSSGIYGKYHLYQFDINYHFGNVYSYFLGDIKMIPTMQTVLGPLSGIYDITGQVMDSDQGIMLPSLVRNTYVPQIFSIFLLSLVTVCLMLSGIYLFERQAIY